MLLIKRFSKSKRSYWFLVRLKAIKYKEDCLSYLSSTFSLYPIVLPESFIIFLLVLMICLCMHNVQYIGRPLPLDFTKTPSSKLCMDHPIGSFLQTPLLDHLVVTH